MNKTFAEKLANLRAEKDFTQRELGAMAGVAWSMISKYESGQSMPRLKVLMRLAEALGVSIDELRGDSKKMQVTGLKIYEGFSTRLVNARHKANISRKKLSDATGIPQDDIADLELAVLLPFEEDIGKLADALGVSAQELAGTRDEEEVVQVHFTEPGSEEEPGTRDNLVAVPADAYRNFLSVADRFDATPGQLMSAIVSREVQLLDHPIEDVPPLADFVERVKAGDLS